MSVVKREWLLHGCLNVGSFPRDDRPATDLKDRIAKQYGGARFRARGWPQRGFRDTLWWSEQNIPHRYGSAYMLKLDCDRGPAFHVGINVEKGFEDRDVAMRRAAELREPIQQLLLTKDWDWHRALKSFPDIGASIQGAARSLGVPLYCWVEFGKRDDAEYFMVTGEAIYRRGGFKPVGWSTVADFAAKSRPRKWGRLSVMRSFSLDECTPALDAYSIMSVFAALRGVRDLWRGIGPTSAGKMGNRTA